MIIEPHKWVYVVINDWFWIVFADFMHADTTVVGYSFSVNLNAR